MRCGSVRSLGFRVCLTHLSLFGAALVMSACSSSTGTLTVTWTIGSTAEASLCDKYGASNVAVLIKNSSGNPYTNTTPECSALTTTDTNVPTGTYSVYAQLLDATGSTASNYIGPVVVNVTSGNTTIQNIDFPIASLNTNLTTGTLNVIWTIASSSADTQCSTYGAAKLSISLSSNGKQYGSTVTAACADETTSIPNLAPGTYTVNAQMVDAAGQPVSSVIATTNVTIAAQTTTPQLVDFPVASFSNSQGTPDAGN